MATSLPIAPELCLVFQSPFFEVAWKIATIRFFVIAAFVLHRRHTDLEQHKSKYIFHFWVTILLTLVCSALHLSSGPNPDIKDGTLLYFPWAIWVHIPKQQESWCWMGIQSADLCFYCHSRPAWIGKTSRKARRLGQRATISCKNGHRRQKYFLSLIFSSISIFTLWLPFIPHFPSCFIWGLLFSSPSWNILKSPPQVTGAVFRANLLDFYSIKQSSAKYLPRSGGWHSFWTPAGGKAHNKRCPLLATVRSALHQQGKPNTVRVSSVFALQASDGIHAWTVIHHQKGHSFTRWFL